MRRRLAYIWSDIKPEVTAFLIMAVVVVISIGLAWLVDHDRF